MPRGGSRGRSGGSRSPPPRSSFTSSRPMPTQQPRPMPATHQGSTGMMGGIGSTIMTGMAFGAGSEVAHQAVRGIMGNSPSQVQQHQAEQNLQYPPQQNMQTQNPCQL